MTKKKKASFVKRQRKAVGTKVANVLSTVESKYLRIGINRTIGLTLQKELGPYREVLVKLGNNLFSNDRKELFAMKEQINSLNARIRAKDNLLRQMVRAGVLAPKIAATTGVPLTGICEFVQEIQSAAETEPGEALQAAETSPGLDFKADDGPNYEATAFDDLGLTPDEQTTMRTFVDQTGGMTLAANNGAGNVVAPTPH